MQYFLFLLISSKFKFYKLPLWIELALLMMVVLRNEVNLNVVLVIMNNLKCLQEGESIDVNVKQLILLTTGLLNDLIEEEDSICESVFNSNSIPNIQMPDFMRRLHKYTKFSAQCLIIAIIYIDRYNLSEPSFSLNHRNIHKIVLTGILLAAKYQDDFYYDNKAFEFAGGVNALHLHQLELQFFKKLNYNLYVDQNEYEELRMKLYEVYGQEEQN